MSVNIWSNGKLVPIASSGTYVYNMPLGSIIAFSGDNIPDGFLLCDGSTLNKNEYLDLFNVIGYTYGGSDNEFKLPDLRDKFAQGANGNLGESIEAGLPNITASARNSFVDYNLNPALRDLKGALKEGSSLPKTHYTEAKISSEGIYHADRSLIIDASKGETKTDGTLKTADEHHVYGASDTVQPPAVAINYIIKATDYKDVPYSALDDSATTTGNVWSAAKGKEIDNKNNYSTEETVIGKWIDGKPIYRKVGFVDSNVAIPASMSGTVKLSWFNTNKITTVDKIIEFKSGQEGQSFISCWRSCKINSTGVSVSNGGGDEYGFSDSTMIIIEYTKTTD